MAEPGYAPIVRGAARFEEIVLGLLLSVMILLACLQIVLRSAFDSGLLWADPLLRHLVLWSGLLGASMAVSRGNHIAIDLAAYLIPKQLLPLVRLLCHLFSAITSGFLTWASVLFLRSEIEFGSPGLLGLPSWGWNLIFPLAFILITLRFLVLFITTAVTLLRRQPSAPGEGQ
jgi:TRAP-type C4-dicarboxylate transport system permease small subunit